MDFLLYIGYLLLGSTIFFFLFPLVPGWIDGLTNNPNANEPLEKPLAATDLYPKSTRGFFTYLQPGRVKIIERGDRFIRCLMKFDGHLFKGERPDSNLTMRQAEYWEIDKCELGEKESDPIPLPWKKWRGLRRVRWFFYSPASLLFWAWKKWVYTITGAVFTGIYPFQRVRVVPVERFKKEAASDGKIQLIKEVDWSDHYRVLDFQFPVLVPNAHTQDKMPVKVLVNPVFRVDNAYKTAYYTDENWSSRLLADVSGAITAFARSRKLDNVLTAENAEVEKELAEHVYNIGQESKDGPTVPYGIITPHRPQIVDISPSRTEDDQVLGDLARARVDRSASEERAKGNAAPIREMGAALREYPEAAVIPQVEGMIRTAQAAGDKAIFIVGGTQAISPGEATIVRELRDKPKAPAQAGG
jgi:hypothetical protein